MPGTMRENEESMDDDAKLMQLVDKAIVLKNRSEMGYECLSEVTDVITSSEEFVKKIHTPTATYWDMKILHSSSLALNYCLQSVTSVLGVFDPDVFAENLVKFVKDATVTRDERLHWNLLENKAAASFKRTPTISYFLGNIDRAEPTEKPQRQRSQRQKTDNEPYKNPRGLQQAQKEEVDMEERMQHISTMLVRNYIKNKKKPLDFLSFVLDPDSFSKTLENIFHVSHLVREGIFDLNQGEGNAMPTVAPMRRDKKADGSSRINQNLWHLSFRVNTLNWGEMKETLEIQKPMI